MLDFLVSALCDMIAHALELFVTLILPAFSFDVAMFNTAFPFAGQAYDIIQKFALGITLIIATVQLVPLLFFSKKATSTPVRILISTVIAVFGIFYGNYILDWIMEIAKTPYNALLHLYAADDSIESLAQYITFTPLQLGIQQMTLGATAGAGNTLLYLILLCLIGYSFIKLLLEVIERYIIMFVLVYLSPLASCTLASDTTSGIFKKYFSMFIAQCILMILNIWCLEMTISMFASLNSNGFISPSVILLMGYTFLRVASKMDSYLNQLGLNTAVTGAGVGSELMATGMMLMSRLNPAMAGAGAAAGVSGRGGAMGGLFGAAQKISDTIATFDPTRPLTDFMTHNGGASARAAGSAAWAAAEAENGGYLSKLRAAGSAFGESMRADDSWLKESAKDNIWARAVYNSDTDHPGMDLLNKDDLSAADLNDIATAPYMGDDIMNNLTEDTAIDDPTAVASVMQSIGMDRYTQEGGEAIAVGYGNLAGENVSFSANETGIHAEYERDGKLHSMDIKNAQQFESLNALEQQGYSSFKNREGTQYYYKHDAQRAVSAHQKQQNAAQAAYANVVADPMRSAHTPDSMAYMSKTPGALSEYLNAFSDGPIPQQQATDTWQAIQPGGSLTGPYNQGLDMLARGQASMERQSGVDTLQWNDPSSGEMHSFSISTAPFGESSTPMKQRDGSVVYGSYQAPPTQEQKIMSAAKTFATDHGISSTDWAAAQNFRPTMKTQLMTDVYDSYKDAGQNISIGDTPEVRTMVADRLDALDFRSLGLNQNTVGEFSSKLRSGEAAVLYEGSRGTQVEYKDGNKTHTFTLVTEHAMESNGPEIKSGANLFSHEYLGNKGFAIKNIGKGNYYATQVESLPNEQLSRKSRRLRL